MKKEVLTWIVRLAATWLLLLRMGRSLLGHYSAEAKLCGWNGRIFRNRREVFLIKAWNLRLTYSKLPFSRVRRRNKIRRRRSDIIKTDLFYSLCSYQEVEVGFVFLWWRKRYNASPKWIGQYKVAVYRPCFSPIPNHFKQIAQVDFKERKSLAILFIIQYLGYHEDVECLGT